MSYDIEEFGFVVIQVSLADNYQTRFDIWGVCDNGITLADMLRVLGFDHLTEEFEAARVFADTLSHVGVPFLRVTIAKADPYSKSAKLGVEQLAFVVNISDVNIPSHENPILALEGLQITLEHQSPMSKDKIGGIKVDGTATLNIGGINALITFEVNPGRKDLETFVSDEAADIIDGGNDTKTTTSSKGFRGDVELSIEFDGDAPSFKDIMSHFAGSLEEDGILGEMMESVPTPLADVIKGILGFVEYKQVSVTVSRTADTQKWAVSRLYLEVEIGGDLIAKLNDVFKGKMRMEEPVLAFTILNPSDKLTCTWNINVSGSMVILGVLTEVRTNFFQPPAGLQANPAEFGLEIDFGDTGGNGLKLGEIFMHFTEAALEETGLDIAAVIPEDLRDAISSIDVRAIRVGFTDISPEPSKSNFKLKSVEAVIEAAKEPWKIIDDFEITDILLHFTHNTGAFREVASLGPPVKSTDISLEGKLEVRSHQYFYL
jgi:hypothetical protein